MAKQLLGHPPVPILPRLEKEKNYTILMFFMSVPTLLDAEEIAASKWVIQRTKFK